MRDALGEIRSRGAELVVVGNGSAEAARQLRRDYALDRPVIVDPELVAYQAAGLRRGSTEMLLPRLPLDGLRAYMRGARQGILQGDLWQLGGVFVVLPDERVKFSYSSRTPGDQPSTDQILAALETEGPTLAGRDARTQASAR